MPIAMLLATILLMPGAPPPEATTEARRIARAVEARLQALHERGEFDGAICMTDGEELLIARGYGLADRERKRPWSVDTVSCVGSLTKQFTAVAILQLVAAGRVSLDDDVRDFVPGLDTRDRSITIEQVLTHTSGLPNLVDREDFDTLARQDHTVDELLRLTEGVPLWFEPGQGFRYSDTGYILLGAIIERVSGLPYDEYLEERVLAPLGMSHTRYGHDATIIEGRAEGYSVVDGVVVNAPYLSMTVPHAAGGLFSTVDDLLTWSSALEEGRLVPLDLLSLAWSSRTLPDGTVSGYGFGWKVCTLAGRPTREHGGFINGFLANAMRLPEEDLDVIVLVNNDADKPDAGKLARRLARLVLTGDPDPHFTSLTPAQMAALEGWYEIAPGDVRRIFQRDGALYSKRNDADPLALVALGPTELTLAGGDEALRFTFEMGGDGRAESVRTSLRCEPGSTGRQVHEE